MQESQAHKDWTRNNTTIISIRLNNHRDSDILKRLSEEESRQGYIKRLIRADMEQAKSD